MKKLINLLLCFLVLFTLFGCKQEEEVEEREPLYYSDPFYIYVKKDSGIETVDDLKDKKIGIQTYYDTQYVEYVKEQLSYLELTDDSYIETYCYRDYVGLIQNNEIDAWVLPENAGQIIFDYLHGYDESQYKTIVEYRIPYYEEKVDDNPYHNHHLYNEPFVVMINGLDERGDTTSTSFRNDVNHLMVVNPEKRHILIVSFPRDSYIYNTKYQYNDKLTHINVYGGPEVICDSIGNALDIEVDNYCVVTFDSFIDLINGLGGVEIDVPMDTHMDMDSYRNVANGGIYDVTKGYKNCYGEYALTLARNRKYNGIANSDYSRIRNQALIIDSIIEKIANHPFLLNEAGVAWYAKKWTNTNFSDSEILVLIELAKKFAAEGYTIDNYFIGGTGTYINEVYYSQMVPETIEIAKGKAKLALEGTVDETSPYYEEIMTGYITGGAGVRGDGGNQNGYIGEEYDLNEVFPQEISAE